jgi:hypothetical protein
MSTLMSVDMNIERSSTRLHAPPGGKSSFSLSYDEPAKAAAPRKVVQQENTIPAAKPVSHAAAPAANNVRVIVRLLVYFLVCITDFYFTFLIFRNLSAR